MVNVVMKTMCCFHKKGVNRSFSKSPESKIFNILTEGTAIGTTEHVDTYFHLKLMWSSFTVSDHENGPYQPLYNKDLAVGCCEANDL